MMKSDNASLKATEKSYRDIAKEIPSPRDVWRDAKWLESWTEEIEDEAYQVKPKEEVPMESKDESGS